MKNVVFELDEEKKRFPGDKSYKSPEYSDAFHKKGSIRPLVNFGHNYKPSPVTTAHLISPLPNVTPDSNLSVTEHEKIKTRKELAQQKQEMNKLETERAEVLALDQWEPASPLKSPDFREISRRYGPQSIGFIRKCSEDGNILSNSKNPYKSKASNMHLLSTDRKRGSSNVSLRNSRRVSANRDWRYSVIHE